MLNQIKKATVEELQSQIKFLRRDIQHAESWLQELKQAETVLTNLYLMEDRGKTMTALKKQIQDSLPDIESRSNFICPNWLV